MMQRTYSFLDNAAESLAGAESELDFGRYNNAANRAYYACFQAAVVALDRTGIRPQRADGLWGHDFVQAQYVGQLINRRKEYPAELRRVLEQAYMLRRIADYRLDFVSRTEAARIVRRARALVTAV